MKGLLDGCNQKSVLQSSLMFQFGLVCSVHKDPTTKKLQVGSIVLKVSAQVYIVAQRRFKLLW